MFLARTVRDHTSGRLVKPRNPRSAAQLSVRDDTSNLSKTWQTLTPTAIVAFNSYASSTPVKNRLGLSIYLTGINWFVKLNRTIDYLGGTRLLNGVLSSIIFQTYSSLNKIFSTNPFQLVLNLLVPTPSSDVYYLVYVSKPKSAGISSNGQYKLLTSLPSTGVFLTSKAAQMING